MIGMNQLAGYPNQGHKVQKDLDSSIDFEGGDQTKPSIIELTNQNPNQPPATNPIGAEPLSSLISPLKSAQPSSLAPLGALGALGLSKSPLALGGLNPTSMKQQAPKMTFMELERKREENLANKTSVLKEERDKFQGNSQKKWRIEGYQAIAERVNAWESKHQKVQEKREAIRQMKEQKEKEDQIQFKFHQCITCAWYKNKEKQKEKELKRKQKMESLTSSNQELQIQIEKFIALERVMNSRSEEEEKIYKARRNWTTVRKKLQVIKMMGRCGIKFVVELREKKDKISKEKEDIPQAEDPLTTKLIIPPDSTGNMYWNNFVTLMFVVYIFIAPIFISYDTHFKGNQLKILLAFDILFVIDRIADVFVGFEYPDGKFEKKLHKVIEANFTNKLPLEFVISFAPLFFDTKNMNTLVYGAFKVPRYMRISEMDNQIDEIMEVAKSQKRSVSELNSLAHILDILKFFATTMIKLHLLTCVQIILCKHREDFSVTWMGGQDVLEDDSISQYIIAIYFVTTTLSTCGFGDISATKRDAVESAVILGLQFVGMLFYSMTIEKVQSFMVVEEVTAGEYGNFMVEVVENLIVKVGRQIPPDKKIDGKVINMWKQYTLKYFQLSPNAFLAENENYNVLSENVKVKIVRENLMLEFQDRFDILFIDPEFNFKADNRLITKVIASLSYEHFEPEESILRLDVVSSEIYFIYEGNVEVTYKDHDDVLIYFDEGSYIGDTSYIFEIRNQYKYRCIQDGKSKARIYALHDKYLVEIFNDFPEFKNVLQIRALRRHHYLRKLKNQHQNLYHFQDLYEKAENQKGASKLRDGIQQLMLQYRKARLVEDQISYEDLALIENFDDDEVTFALNRQIIKNRKDKMALQMAKKLQTQLQELKQISVDGMKAVVETINSINDNSKKIVFKNFEQAEVNILLQRAPAVLENLQQARRTTTIQHYQGINEDDYDSDSSGNQDENDRINQITQIQQLHTQSNAVGTDGDQMTTLMGQPPRDINASIKQLYSIAAGDLDSDLATDRPRGIQKLEGGSPEYVEDQDKSEVLQSERSDLDVQNINTSRPFNDEDDDNQGDGFIKKFE